MAGDEVSPPTRGWTGRYLPAARRRDIIGGFPAHAGMDRTLISFQIPYGFRGFPAHAGMDPLKRGTVALVLTVGFPAHAGMDPTLGPTRRRCSARFPRPRGDGPLPHAQVEHLMVSPPTRGPSSPYGGTVSPPTRGWTLANGLTEGLADHLMVSPPTRGWTRPLT